MSQSTERKFQLLLHKLGYLKLELEEKRERLDDHEKNFNENYAEDSKIEEPPTDSSTNNEGDDPEPLAEEKLDDPEKENNSAEGGDNDAPGEVEQEGPIEEIRKIWKSIAIKTHPDKTGNDPVMTALYKRASAAYDERQYEVLMDVAAQLSIRIENPSEQLIKLLEERVGCLESDLKRINDSVLWTWATATPEKKRAIENALRSYRKHRKKKKSKG